MNVSVHLCSSFLETLRWLVKREPNDFLTVLLSQKRRGKNESDDDFVPGKGAARKAKGRSRARKRGGGAGGGGGSEEEESEELEEELFEPETEEESLRFSATSSETELESDGSIYEPRGRNAKRAAAFKGRHSSSVRLDCWTWWCIGWVDYFQLEGRGFDSRSSRHVGTLGKSFT